jgi:ubiquinone/menaquinone biosynthesis C-methylase UbiE
MFSSLVPIFRCPGCFHSPVRWTGSGIECPGCRAHYPARDGILDFTPPGTVETITPFQRVMQNRQVVAVYERLWRRLGYFLASSRSFDREMKTVLGHVGRVPGDRLLDLACGPGVFTRPIAKARGTQVVGFDLSWPMLRYAERTAREEGIANIAWIRGTVFRLPFIAGAFPGVNCCGALHLFTNSRAALQEITRVLAPAGHLSVQTTLRPARSAGFASVLERYIRFGFFQERELSELLRDSGLSVLESERHRISFTFLARRQQLTGAR